MFAPAANAKGERRGFAVKWPTFDVRQTIGKALRHDRKVGEEKAMTKPKGKAESARDASETGAAHTAASGTETHSQTFRSDELRMLDALEDDEVKQILRANRSPSADVARRR